MNAVTVQLPEVDVPVREFVEKCVDVERFLDCCRQCGSYGHSWSCPPFDFDPLEFWNRYETVTLYARKIITPQELLDTLYTDTQELILASRDICVPVKHAMMDELFKKESQIPGSYALSAGSCDLCGQKCARTDNLPCRLPGKMRHSIESLGGNVTACLENYLGEKLLWGSQGHMAPYYIMVGGLLRNESRK